ncbi:NfeD family protein [Rheinheimera baltica]|uniref:NfeD family protein n=1 Tax=Rheinheimera baltica TaxID=67576 RepID=A0ABT9HVF7_9GAMM|nr:NfeD family protein [Rheinheimera baltica]MDP5135109.1 NfeD family protein [Rheinheimera baltica]
MNIATLWIIVGIVLILSELMATSIVAVFFGIAAIIVGLLLNIGVIESYSTQFMLFGVLSLVLLFSTRSHFKRWFVGYTADSNEQPSRFADDIGSRVNVHTDFTQGAGRVVLNGVQWDAESSDALHAGDIAWVVANHGIKLVVSATKPN